MILSFSDFSPSAIIVGFPYSYVVIRYEHLGHTQLYSDFSVEHLTFSFVYAHSFTFERDASPLQSQYVDFVMEWPLW